MILKHLAMAALAFGALSCTAQKQKTKASETAQQQMKDGYPTAKPAANVIRLSEGENTFNKDLQMNITFVRLLEDSRCPEGANCVWMGAAKAEVELMGTATRPMRIQLATVDNTARNLQQSAVFNGYSITLENVYPNTTTARGYQDLKGKYVIDLKIAPQGKGNKVNGPATR